jgi:hypothetical protein
MDLVFNIYLGLTLAVSDYSKSLNYEYESLRAESYGFNSSLSLSEKFYFDLGLKRLSAQVQSESGNLNVFGWDYTHDIANLRFGFNLEDKTKLFLGPAFYYMPVLFPTQVGALSSEAAFEKVPQAGFELGYGKEFKFEDFDLIIESSFLAFKSLSSDYEDNYNLLLDLEINPSLKISKHMRLGVNYNVIVGQFSFIENKTGLNYPFKSRYSLQNLFLSLTYTLR